MSRPKGYDLAIFLFFSAVLQVNASSYDFDVVVYGATASGVTAAIAASNEGVKVLLVEPQKNVGGMVTGGLSHTDYGDRTVIGGLTYQFYQKVADFYKTQVFYWRGPEPHVGEQIMLAWLKEAGVTLWFEKRLSNVQKRTNTIEKIVFTDGTEVSAKIFIDAGYEGDLMAGAGVSYTYGREGIKDYNESYAGRQPVTFTTHQIDARISPFNNDRERKLLPLVQPKPMVPIGEGDGGIMAYCFRMIATNKPENMQVWSKPDRYNPATYELARRYYQAKPDAEPLISFWPTLPNGKSDINSSLGISTNLLDGSSWKYPDADYRQRDSIWQWHRDYTLGLAWFLATDSAVPLQVRKAMKTFGLCKDEYVNNQHFPHQLYIREARRMKGEYFMTQHDLMCDTVKYDAIGMGSYNIDVREMQRNFIEISRFPDMKFETYNEGYLSIPVSKYEIPYRSLLPKSDECQNLMVPVCLSSSHIAIASIRMEPQYMIMGESAGTAAALAIKTNRTLHTIDVFALQEKLKNNKQVLSLKENPYGLWNSENEIIIDNNMKGFTYFTGDWKEEETVHTGRYEMNFRYKPIMAEGDFEFNPYLFKTGNYEVSVWSPSSPHYSSKVPVEVNFMDGKTMVYLNQQVNGGKWIKIGNWTFEKGQKQRIRIIGEKSNFVIADAVKFELK